MKKGPSASGRDRLVEAALRSVATHGYRRSTVRTIAGAAGLTPSAVTHHFESKDALMRASYCQFRDGLLQAYVEAADQAEPDPLKRLESFVRTIFVFNAEHPENFRIWVGFLELVVTDSQAAAVQRSSYDRYLWEIRSCLTGIYAARGEQLSPNDAHKAALGVNCVIDGVWLECCMNPSRLPPDMAVQIVLEIIGATLGVSF